MTFLILIWYPFPKCILLRTFFNNPSRRHLDDWRHNDVRNDLKMAYFEPFWLIFDSITYYLYIFSYAKWPGQPNVDHSEGQKCDFHSQIDHYELKNGQNNHTWPKMAYCWPGSILIWCCLMRNDQGNLIFTIQRVNILISSSNWPFWAQKEPKWPQNGLFWPILSSKWSIWEWKSNFDPPNGQN